MCKSFGSWLRRFRDGRNGSDGDRDSSSKILLSTVEVVAVDTDPDGL